MRRFQLLVMIGFLAACLSVSLAGQAGYSKTIDQRQATEAASGFDDKTNGFISQQEFNEAMGVFNRHYFERDGLGPVFNAETCFRCHQFPTIGGFSLNTVSRAGKFDGKRFTPHPGGLVLQVAATRPDWKKQLAPGFDIISPRLSTSMLGDGYIEAIADDSLRAIATEQPKKSNGKISGEIVEAAVLEAPGTNRVGRFGWKSSQASMLSFVGEAFRNEIGLTNPLYTSETSSVGKEGLSPVTSTKPEIDMLRIETVTRFIRATKAPLRDIAGASHPDAKAGEKLFASIGCAICHVPAIRTSPVGTKLNGGKFIVPEALGDKQIYPYSDFLLHDVGTGDGIVESTSLTTRNKLRTAPLWGLGARMKRLGDHLVLLHDGSSKNLEDAILRHAGEATYVTDNFKALTEEEKRQVIRYLTSL